MRKILVLAVSLVVSACALQTLKEGLPYLVGEPIDSAVNLLGYPNSSMEMNGFTIYEWSNQYSTTVPITQTNTAYTTGYVGTTPVYGTTNTYSTNYIPVNNQCRIRLAVDEYNIIRRWEYFGNQGGCQYYANGIKRIIPKK